MCNLESDEANPDGILIDGMECKVVSIFKRNCSLLCNIKLLFKFLHNIFFGVSLKYSGELRIFST